MEKIFVVFSGREDQADAAGLFTGNQFEFVQFVRRIQPHVNEPIAAIVAGSYACRQLLGILERHLEIREFTRSPLPDGLETVYRYIRKYERTAKSLIIILDNPAHMKELLQRLAAAYSGGTIELPTCEKLEVYVADAQTRLIQPVQALARR